MGTGVNCSYSVSNGTYVPLLCDEGVLFCCTSSASTGAVFCSKANCSASGLANEATNTDITAYIFWVILAASGAVTIIVLILSYAVCRFRKPGCADASTLRDQFLEEHILAAQLRSGTTLGNNTPANSATPFSTSPPNGLTPASSPDLLVHPNRSNGHIGQDQGRPHAHVVPSKIPVPNAAVNRAFVMSAEAFSKKPVKVQRSSVKGRPFASKGVDYSSHTDMASPRLVHVGGITPRVPLRDKGRTESKQTILSRDESLTAVET